MIENVSTQLTVFHCLCPLPASRKGLRLPLRSALFGEGGRDWRPCSCPGFICDFSRNHRPIRVTPFNRHFTGRPMVARCFIFTRNLLSSGPGFICRLSRSHRSINETLFNWHFTGRSMVTRCFMFTRICRNLLVSDPGFICHPQPSDHQRSTFQLAFH